MPSITCTCGRQINVREGQAGTSVHCECGQELIVPGLRTLRKHTEDGTPVAGVVTASEAPMSLEDRQFLVFLTHPHVLPLRISFDAASHFVTACDRLLHGYFDEVERTWNIDLQVSMALLPDGKTLVDIQIQPPIVPSQAVTALTNRLEEMPRPPVVNGPVAFTIRKPICGGASGTVRFDFPFHSYARNPAELDQLLMQAAGISPPAGTMASAEPHRFSVWKRFRSRLRTWRSRRLSLPDPTTEAATTQSNPPSNSSLPDLTTVLQSASIEEVEACLKRHPDAVPLYYHLGQLQLHAGNYQQAVDAFTESLERDPENLAAYASRGRAHVLAGSMQQGLADYTRAIDGDPADAESRAARAMIYIELEAWEFAESDLTAAIGLTPIQPQLYVERARVRYAQEKVADVLEDLRQAHRLDPYHVEAYMLHGWALQHRPNATFQDIADATQYYGRAIQIDPQTPGYYVQRAEAHASQSKFALAIADCDRALQLDEEHAIAFGIRGYAHQQLENLDEAVADCSRVLNWDCGRPPSTSAAPSDSRRPVIPNWPSPTAIWPLSCRPTTPQRSTIAACCVWARAISNRLPKISPKHAGWHRNGRPRANTVPTLIVCNRNSKRRSTSTIVRSNSNRTT